MAANDSCAKVQPAAPSSREGRTAAAASNKFRAQRAEKENSSRILIVDDTRAIHEDFRKVLTRSESTALEKAEAELFGKPATAVERANFILDSAYQGKEALELVKRAMSDSRPYALAFVDVRMPPGWDGIETIAHLDRKSTR